MTEPTRGDRAKKSSAQQLLQEFPKISRDEWEAAIARDIKGEDYERKLVWETEDGLAIQPYYRAEDVAKREYLASAPGDFPFLRGDRSNGDWSIREEIYEPDPEKANRAARSALKAGAEAVEFRNIRLTNQQDLETLLQRLAGVEVHFYKSDASLLQLLLSAGQPIHGSAGFNPLINLDGTARILQSSSAPATLLPFIIDAGSFAEAGGTIVQEVGFTLAAGINFLGEMQSRQIATDQAAASLAFSFSIGTSYFFQIAKLRAFRLLWARAIEAFGGSAEAAKARMHARTSSWNETIYNPYVNILRATTEAMSAAIGGADSISVAPFDECYKIPDEATRRLARNTQILLKQESQLARVADPGGGSYYLELLTESLAKEAWQTMQQIEADGGFLKAHTAGKIDAALAESELKKTQTLLRGARFSSVPINTQIPASAC